MFKSEDKLPLKVAIQLALGVMTMVLLMFSLTFSGVNYLTQLNYKMSAIVEKNNEKSELVHVMQNALRERALSIYIMTVIKDDYLKGEELKHFKSLAADYFNARSKLESIASSTEEKSVLSGITDLSRQAQSEVEGVVPKLLRGDSSQYYDAIQNRIVPYQKKINELLLKLWQIQKNQTTIAVKDAESSYEYARELILALGMLASILIVVVAVLFSRKILKQTRAMAYQSYHDDLTRLPNRILFLERLEQAIANAFSGGDKFAIILLDLDRFKEVNDTLGHHVGDQLLKEVSGRLQRNVVRPSDTIARLGGDEFVILLDKCDVQNTANVAEKILEELDASFIFSDQMIDVSASLGIVHFPAHGEDSLTLLQKADVAMHAAKQNQSGFVVYSESLEKGSRPYLTFKSELMQAMARDELVLYFQPKIDLRTRKVTSVEALVRWQHPQRGFLPPDQFIPMVEQIGMINQLTFWVLKKALELCAEFNRAGLKITVAVNLSARSLLDLRLPGEIARMLGEAKINPSMLVLEITESAVMADPEEALNVLKILDRMGVALAIDDFGTGYSSLAYLSKLPVDEIKIDKSFVLEMVQDQSADVIVRSTIELGHNLDLKVVAEGVETLEIMDILAVWGCDTAQGYYMSKPLPVDQLMRWIKESPWKLTV